MALLSNRRRLVARARDRRRARRPPRPRRRRYTPITYLHATVAPGSRLTLPWPRDFNALVYVLAGRGYAGVERAAARRGPARRLRRRRRDHDPRRRRSSRRRRTAGWEVLVLGGLPIREPVARYGPFVMNTREEIVQAVEDFQAGRMGTIPATARAAPHERRRASVTSTRLVRVFGPLRSRAAAEHAAGARVGLAAVLRGDLSVDDHVVDAGRVLARLLRTSRRRRSSRGRR